MEENNKEKENEKKVNNFKNIRHTIVVYLTMAVVTFGSMIFIFSTVLINAYIPSESMETTLMVGDRLIGNRLAYKFGNDPKRFDVVIFYTPDSGELYIKRVIGLPGEKVTIKDGEVYINDSKTPLDDSFIREPMETDGEQTYEVPENCYFMMGDNRNESYDSRFWNNPYVSKDKIVAKASLKLWKGIEIVK